MPRRKGGERVLGPYEHGPGYRVVEVAADGSRVRRTFPTEKAAEQYRDLLQQQIVSADYTTETALDVYVEHLEAKGNKPGSVVRTRWAVGKFFPRAIPLWALTPKKLKDAYVRAQVGLSVDSHRNALAEVKTFLAWCVEEGILATHPAAELKGIGKRKKRKAQLPFKEARAWFTVAKQEAEAGEDGAVAALMTLLLGMRASEITHVTVRDLDEEDAPFDTLWIPDAKTEAGRRTLEVPEMLRPLLAERVRGRGPDALLFPCADGKPHWRDWPRENVQRLCKKAGVGKVTAHGMRGLLATLTLRKGALGQAAADMLGHEDERTTHESYAAPGAAAAGARKRGMGKLESVPAQPAKPTKKSGGQGT